MTTAFSDQSIIDDLNLVIAKDLQRQIEIYMLPAAIITWGPGFWQLHSFITDEESLGDRMVLSEIFAVIFAPREQVQRVLRSGKLIPPPVTQVPPPRPPPPPPTTRRVTLPREIQRALFALQRRGDDIEYGGAIDFEITGDRPEIERIVAFLGGTQMVSKDLFTRFSADFEVHFHTHPNRDTAQPSRGDLLFSLDNPQSVMIIVAEDDMAIFFKEPGAAKVTALELDGLIIKSDVARIVGINQFDIQERDTGERFFEEQLGIVTQRIKRTSRRAVPLNIEVVRHQMSRGAVQT